MRPSLTPEYQRDWPAYFDAVRALPARDTLVRALSAFEHDAMLEQDVGVERGEVGERWAIDVACGEGRDTREMLRRERPIRWRVLAIDASNEGLARLRDSIGPGDRGRVRTLECAMEEIPGRVGLVLEGVWDAALGGVSTGPDLINASFALPFCHEDHFPNVWKWVRERLAPGGRFAGQFFGERDEWAVVNPRRHHTRAQIESLFAGWTMEYLDEVEKEGADAMGGSKYHHVFHVVARKPGTRKTKDTNG